MTYTRDLIDRGLVLGSKVCWACLERGSVEMLEMMAKSLSPGYFIGN